MSMQNKDLRTLGYVLKRTNSGEFDRILNIITPLGKISAIAKGVRKEKSKLAGSIEMFTLVDFNIHSSGKNLDVITGAKMLKYYSGIVGDLDKLELGSSILKKASKAVDGLDSEEYFNIVDQSLKALDDSNDLQLIESWYLLNLKKIMGEEINLYRDINGDKLSPDKFYSWDDSEIVFTEDMNGEYGANEIKLLRLMMSNGLDIIRRVKLDNDIVGRILRLSHRVV